jgi:hypothetical protein
MTHQIMAIKKKLIVSKQQKTLFLKNNRFLALMRFLDAKPLIKKAKPSYVSDGAYIVR